MTRILFQSRYSRNTSQFAASSRKHGRMCTVVVNGVFCSTLVLDLKTHLQRIHCLSYVENEFIRAIQTHECVERQVYFRQNNIIKANPMHYFSSQQKFDSIVGNNCSFTIGENTNEPSEVDSTYDFESSETQEEETTTPEWYKLNLSEHFSALVNVSSFQLHSATISGGLRSK